MRWLVSYRENNSMINWGRSACKAIAAIDGQYVLPYGWNYDTHEPIAPRPDPATIDVVLWLEANDEQQQYIELAVYRDRCPMIMWENDIEHCPTKISQLIGFLRPRVLLTANVAVAKLFRTLLGIPSILFPFGVDTQFLATEEEMAYDRWSNRRYHATFIGRPSDGRSALSKTIDVPLTQVYDSQYIEMLKQSKVSVHGPCTGGANLIAMRPFEILAAGAALCVGKDDAVLELSQLGLMRHYIYHDMIRQNMSDCYLHAIAKSGWEYVRENHLWGHRAAMLVELAGKLGVRS